MLEIEALTTLRFNYSASEPATSATEPPTPLATTDKVPVLDDLPVIGRLFRSSSNEASSAFEETNQLYSRRFKIEPDKFPTEPPHVNYEGGIYRLTRTNKMQAANQAIQSLFAGSGVDLQPPKYVFYNDRLGELFVRASLADLDRITPLLAEFVETAPADYNGTNAALLVQSARLLMEAGQRESAKAKLQLALEIDPTNRAAKHYLGFVTESNEQGHQSQPAESTNSMQAKPLHDDLEEAGSPFNVQAEHTDFDYTTRILTASNGVVIRHDETVITADSARIDQEVGEVVAEGNARLSNHVGVMAGDRITFNYKTRQAKAERFSRGKMGNPPDASVKQSSPQINIQARFVEITRDENRALGFDWYLGNFLMGNSSPTNLSGKTPGQFHGILTDPQYRLVLRAMEQRDGVDTVSQPQVTTMSGRQAQIQISDIRTIVTGIDPKAMTPPGISSKNPRDPAMPYITETIQVGSTLEITPTL